ncbi:MAG TPA: hypothetical protein VMA77_00505 [Solirubrobacteraceae bacterium]|nr:hypothetical protein [Solirubrobacteraceae bacterium]
MLTVPAATFLRRRSTVCAWFAVTALMPAVVALLACGGSEPTEGDRALTLLWRTFRPMRKPGRRYGHDD